MLNHGSADGNLNCVSMAGNLQGSLTGCHKGWMQFPESMWAHFMGDPRRMVSQTVMEITPSFKGRGRQECSWWTATLEQSMSPRRAEMSPQRSAGRPFGLIRTRPRHRRTTQSTTPWQSHQMQAGRRRPLAMRRASSTALTSARNRPVNGLAARTHVLGWWGSVGPASGWTTAQLANWLIAPRSDSQYCFASSVKWAPCRSFLPRPASSFFSCRSRFLVADTSACTKPWRPDRWWTAWATTPCHDHWASTRCHQNWWQTTKEVCDQAIWNRLLQHVQSRRVWVMVFPCVSRSRGRAQRTLS